MITKTKINTSEHDSSSNVEIVKQEQFCLDLHRSHQKEQSSAKIHRNFFGTKLKRKSANEVLNI
jgi:hypothetical protein